MSKDKGLFSKINLDNEIVRIVLIILGSVFSTVILAFSVLAITEVTKDNFDLTSKYLLVVFIVLGLSRFLTYIKDRNKINLIRFITLFSTNIAIGILIVFAKDNPYFFQLCGGLYCITIIISRIFELIKRHKVRNIVYNGLIILFAGFLGTALFIPDASTPVGEPIAILCIVIAISAFFEVVSTATSKLKLKVLVKIIVKTYALEIILGLVTVMVACSLVFTLYEPEMTSFGDALWYSFAVVTTIGFGEIKAVTLVGRILSVIMGIYGIVVVAVITSIIVNFYNETAGKKDAKELKQIDKDDKKDK